MSGGILAKYSKKMEEIIDFMPGLDLPVGDVEEKLSSMWDDGTGPISDFRASQMNLVLHFGKSVSHENALMRFNIAVSFAQRYPSRIIVLCPFSDYEKDMRAKLFSQCYIGHFHREMCCCEALILGYSPEDKGYLFNQVSVWLERDLPLYHWVYQVKEKRIEKYFDNLLKRVNRIAYDSNLEPDLTHLDWLHKGKLVDLAKARLLPLRQAIGQYLSGFEMDLITNNLISIKVFHKTNKKGEAVHFSNWLSQSIGIKKREIENNYITLDNSESKYFGFEFIYSDSTYFSWEQFETSDIGKIKSNYSGEHKVFPLRIKNLLPEQELSEAFYF